MAGKRLRGAVESKRLYVRDVWLYRSKTPWHFHLIVRTQSPMSEALRVAWELYLLSDIFRGINNLARVSIGVSAPMLLISPERYKGFYRLPDMTCDCRRKHDPKTARKCEIMQSLRNANIVKDIPEFFGKPSEPMAWELGEGKQTLE